MRAIHSDSQEIYEAAQRYRNWPITDQKGVAKAFDEMVALIWNAAIENAIRMGPSGILGALLIKCPKGEARD